MDIIYLRCQCDKLLAADARNVGHSIQCPSCGRESTVLNPDLRWSCPRCGDAMSAPGEMEGQKVQCVKCRGRVTVPVIMGSLQHRHASQCPGCGSAIKYGEVLCVNCGLDASLGHKIEPVFEDAGRRLVFPRRTIVLSAASVSVLCALTVTAWLFGRGAKPVRAPGETPDVVPSAPTATAPAPNPSGPAAGVVSGQDQAVDDDARELSAIIAGIASMDNYAAARDVLQAAMIKYPRASNMKDADALLTSLRQAVTIESAMAMCSTRDRRAAAHILETAIHQNQGAPNLAVAQAKLSAIRQEMDDTEAIAAAIGNVQTNVNRLSAVRLLEHAISWHPQATNLSAAKDLLNRCRQDDESTRAAAVPQPPPSDPGALTGIMDNIAIINTKTGNGTGFILNISGKKYLVTNRHVIEGIESKDDLSFDFISGNKPIIAGFEIARDKDLVRFEVEDSFKCGGLFISPTPNKKIGDDVFVFGNSAGAGAITELRGKITGWGPSVIETSAEFVSGNSGSPILDENSNVLAVATFVTQSDPRDWVTKGTRFEGVRRFGLRIDNAEWKKVPLDTYVRQGNILNEAQMYLDDFCAIFLFTCMDNKSDEVKETMAFYLPGDDMARKRTRWSGELVTIVKYYQQISTGRSSGEAGEALCLTKLKGAPLAPKQVLKNTRWIDGWHEKQAKSMVDYIDWLYEYLNNKDAPGFSAGNAR